MMEMRISNSMDALDGDAALSTEQRSGEHRRRSATVAEKGHRHAALTF